MRLALVLRNMYGKKYINNQKYLGEWASITVRYPLESKGIDAQNDVNRPGQSALSRQATYGLLAGRNTRWVRPERKAAWFE